jgi:1-deoxy-D-xylulose-5-phosphate reductoisomerase
VAVPGDAQARELRTALAQGLRTEVTTGAQALCDLAAHPEVDAVMAAIVGAAGLAPAWPRRAPASG